MIEERKYGHLTFSRTHSGIRRLVGSAPAFTRLSVRLLATGTGFEWISENSLMVCGQVSYKIVGFELRPPSLVLELIHDYRSENGRG